MDRPKIGVVLVTSGWFRDIGLQQEGSETTSRIGELSAGITERLEAFAEPIYHGVLYSEDEAVAAGKEIRAAGVEAVLLAPLMWCEDQIVRACLKEIPRVPIILWSFSPTTALPRYLEFQTMLQGSGTVCTLQLSGMLKREGYDYHSVAGSLEDGRVFEDIGRVIRSVALKKALSSLRVGVLPFPCSQMSTTYVDEFQLRNCYGIELRYIELSRVADIAANIPTENIASFRKELIPKDAIIEVDDRNLEHGIRHSLALETVIQEDDLGVLAMNDVVDEMHSAFGLRPCLANPRIGERGAVVSMEADIAAGVAMYALRSLSGASPFYTEVFGVDYSTNVLLLGHAGYHDHVNADPNVPVRIVPDIEYENTDRFTGCATYFKYREGPVTVINSVWDGSRLKWLGFEGHSVPGPPRLEGNCHLVCRLQTNVRDFLKTAVESGVSQHWVVVPGHLLDDVAVFCRFANIEFSVIAPTEET
jgi:L-fucose isomerase-like protein